MDYIPLMIDHTVEKVSRVKWLDQEKVCEQPTLFVTASYGNPNENRLSVRSWQMGECKSRELFWTSHMGDTTDMLLQQDNLILTTSSIGSVNIYQYDIFNQTITRIDGYDNLHRIRGQTRSCNGISANSNGLVGTVGDDGIVNILSTHSLSIVFSFVADLSSLRCISFIGESTIAFGNSLSQLKVFDVRERQKKLLEPLKRYSLKGFQGLTRIEQHPAQTHILVVGGEEGSIAAVDTRYPKAPFRLLDQLEGDVREVKFHPTLPNNLLSCCHGGSLNYMSVPQNYSSASGSWVLDEDIKKDINQRNLMNGNSESINTFDVIGDRLICGLDSHQLCLFDGLNVC